LPDLGHAVLDLLMDGDEGLWHLANNGSVSWYEFGLQIAERAKYPTHLIQADHRERQDTTLTSARGTLLPTLADALGRFFNERARSELAATAAVAG
jgi:dTDP-4-dehydrorhamnose reductase